MEGMEDCKLKREQDEEAGRAMDEWDLQYDWWCFPFPRGKTKAD